MSVNNDNLIQLPRRGWMYVGNTAFSGAGVTVEVSVPLKKIKAWALTYAGTPNANEPLSLDETVANSVVAVSGGAVTVRRAAGTTADAKLSYVFYGE